MRSKVPTLFNLSLNATLQHKKLLKFSKLSLELAELISDFDNMFFIMKMATKKADKNNYNPYLVYKGQNKFDLCVITGDREDEFSTQIQRIIASYTLTVIEKSIKIIPNCHDDHHEKELKLLSEYLQREMHTLINTISDACLPKKDYVRNPSDGPCL